LNEATAAGILEDLGGNIYKIHPALPWYLRQQLDKMGSQEVISTLEKKLLGFYAELANNFCQKFISNAPLANIVLRVEEPNLLQQLRLAEQQQQWAEVQFILQALGEVYQRWGRKPEFKSLREWALNQIGIHVVEAKAKGKAAFDFWMYLRGVDANEALESADLETAIAVNQEIINELVALNDPSFNDKIATVYHQLGRVAQEQRRFDDAIAFYNKALQIYEDAGDLYSASYEYQGLGNIAKEQGDFDTAVAYFQKAFTATSTANDWRKASSTLTAWGRTLEAQSNWTEAVKIYIQALEIDIEHNSEWVGSDIADLGRMLKQLGDSQFQVIWREFTGDECPGELFSAIQKASETEEEGAD